jgi:hypothetical protein
MEQRTGAWPAIGKKQHVLQRRERTDSNTFSYSPPTCGSIQPGASHQVTTA